MGYPGKARKTYDAPKHPWQAERLANEVELIKRYGLRNKKEIWKAHSILRRYRSDARRILAEANLIGHTKTEADQILAKLKRYAILKEESHIDDILALSTDIILDRRLQTQVHKKGFAKTLKQARQFITHGHIAISGKKVTIPSVIISKEDESNIGFYKVSALSNDSHLERIQTT
ncbi:MAG: 30S ribosomal protein S4 [Methanosarcinaceae archaeon]|jgi:small subunit ribosomal protein S4|nr:30S ribosomal protein S4 [Methanosarcinaceae archaeon]NKQ38928.1 30S ribosomal protein S4 [Methanosarcinales archaeon]